MFTVCMYNCDWYCDGNFNVEGGDGDNDGEDYWKRNIDTILQPTSSRFINL